MLPAVLGAQAAPKAHPLGAVEATSKDLLTTVSNVRALSDGRLLVLDLNGRKVVLMARDLASWKVVADTTGATGNAFSGRTAGLIAYKGDTSLFVDPTALTMLVIDANGSIPRVIAIPKPNDAIYMIGGATGFPAFDSQWRLVYRGRPPLAPRPACTTDSMAPMPIPAHEAPIVRIDMATRAIDTIASIETPQQLTRYSSFPTRMISFFQTPMPKADDWTVLSNGTVAIVRAVDYHVDWIDASGPSRSTAKIPFDWMHLTDSAKAAFVDSAKAALEKRVAPRTVEVMNEVQTEKIPVAMAGGCGPRPPAPVDGPVFAIQAPAARALPAPEGGKAPAAAAPAARPTPPVLIAGPSFIPDYAPAFAPGSVRADADGNVWVRTSITMGGGSVYDVINDKGQLVDRLIAPPNRVIAGFGPGGVVYMGVREGDGTRLERARRVVVRP